jgi:pimeloyl-ACP methyl ester carboxylesterase
MPALVPIRLQDGAQAALVFVHGFTGKGPGTWADLAPRIAEQPRLVSWDCWTVTYATNWLPDISGIWTADADLPTLANRLSTDLRLGTLARYKALVLIAHSMGGLIVQKVLVDSLEIANRTTAVILFGTPSAGLVKALPIWFWKRQLQGMIRGCPFIRQLRDNWQRQFTGQSPFSFLAVAGERDQFVPPKSSLGPFPLDQRAVIKGTHVSMIHPEANDPNVVDLVVRRIVERGIIDRGDPALRAIEMAQFQGVIANSFPTADKLDREALIRLAVALERVGRHDDAHRILVERNELSSDVLGTIADIFKRRWLFDRQEKDAQTAVEYYTECFELADGNFHEAYYHGINLAFLALVFQNDRESAKTWAQRVLTICQQATVANITDEWLDAVSGEAYLILGDKPSAYDSYQRFVNAEHDPWKLCSAYLNAREVVVKLANREAARRLGTLFGDPDP